MSPHGQLEGGGTPNEAGDLETAGAHEPVGDKLAAEPADALARDTHRAVWFRACQPSTRPGSRAPRPASSKDSARHADDAAWIARLLVLANLRGHDSHGVIRIPQYAEAVKSGGIDPKSPVTVVAETGVTARLDGGRGFGQVVARRGIELAIAKATASGLSAVTLSRTTHVGRLADYAEMAATQGLVGMLWVNAVHGLNVAPWGGAARRLGTNPHAIGIPGAGGPAMVLDFATSVVAEGKMRVKKNRKQQAPPGWFIDAGGRPATDPEIFYGDPVGSLLTAGEHKGYGLSLAVEILGGILSGTGAGRPRPRPLRQRDADDLP